MSVSQKQQRKRKKRDRLMQMHDQGDGRDKRNNASNFIFETYLPSQGHIQKTTAADL